MDREQLVEDLRQALDHVLSALARLGALPPDLPMPDEALDAALRSDDGYQAAQAALREVVRKVMALDEGLGLAVEERANAAVARAAEVGWRLGSTTARSPSRP